MKKPIRFWVLIGLAGGISTALFYTQIYQPKSTYEVVQPIKTDFPVWVQGIGEVDAQRFYSLGFTASGRLTDILADQGDHIDANTIMAQLDSAELTATLEEVKAQYDKALVEITTTQQNIELNQERFNLAKLAYDRNKALLKRNLISQAQFDQTESEMLQADIAVKSARTSLMLITSEVKRIEKSIDVIKVKLDNLNLYAPEDLFVVERLAEAGESVVAGQTIFKVLEPNSLWVRAYIDERVSGKLSQNQTAEIRLRSSPDQIYHGFVKRIDVQSDPITLERVVYLGFKPTLPPPFLFEQAQVKIRTQTLKDVWTLPNKVLSIDNQQPGVWVKKNGRARFKAIELLTSDSEKFAFELLQSSDLNIKSEVIVPDKNKKRLSDDARVFP
ncbi:MAG: efflux RND transporter periplasmic adaptor subunit [Hydrogenovibrio sp.]